MTGLRLEKIDYKNFDDFTDLEVYESQEDFIDNSEYILAEAYAAAVSGMDVSVLGICIGDKPIGLVKLAYFPDLEHVDKLLTEEVPLYYTIHSYLLWDLMIDKKYQGKGYGKESLKLVLDYVRTFPMGEADYFWTTYYPANTAARKLYASFGFEEIRSVIISQGQATFGRAFGILDKCCQL